MIDISSLIEHVIYDGNLPPANPHGYQYILAGNGLFLRAKNETLDVLLALRRCNVRGLPSIEPFVHMGHSKLSWLLLQGVVNHAKCHWQRETAYQITLNQNQFVAQVVALGSVASVKHDDVEGAGQIICDIHSHHTMAAYFSGQDDKSNQDFRWYMVIGRVTSDLPAARLRLGVYGYHFPMPLNTLFKGTLPVQEAIQNVRD
jgi:PRTRC genetic system protein A